MRVKLDENLPVEATELLRTAGRECDTVHDKGLGAARSIVVLRSNSAESATRTRVGDPRASGFVGGMDMALLIGG